MQDLHIQVEKTSNTSRKLTIKVPAKVVASRFEEGLADAQRTAKLKGFRPGQVPLSMVKQVYGDDIRHRLLHTLIDESFSTAVREQQIQAVGRPKIDLSGSHKTGEGAHDHSLNEAEDLTFTATVEVLPEIEVKGYTGVSLTEEKSQVTDEDVENAVKAMLDSNAELIPVSGGLTLADGTQSSRPVQKGDHVDMSYVGGVVNEKGVEMRPDMKGDRLVELGSESLIPGFEDQLVGMRRGDSKTFRLPFPKDFYDATLATQEAEFTATINEVKEKKLPTLDDEFAKQVGYENVADLRKKLRDYLEQEKKNASEQKLRGELIQTLLDKNKFDVPVALIENQTRALAQDVAENLKSQGADDKTIQELIMKELDSLKKRAESQVRASLLLEAIAKKEKIEVTPEEIENEIQVVAGSMKVDHQQLKEFYDKNPSRKEDFVFRLRQERTVKFLLEKSKIKQAK